MPHRPQTIRSRGYLPHWESAGASYAVTFRLADSLPQSVLDSYQLERQSILETAAQMHRELTPLELTRLAHLFSERIEKFLDQGAGECHLRHPNIAQLVFDALHHFHNKRYQLHALCIMPNHVHVLFSPAQPHTLDTILHSRKSYTASEANRILGRRGTFWMPEYFDHLIRDSADFTHARNYILKNPDAAGLTNWPWSATFVSAQAGGRDTKT